MTALVKVSEGQFKGYIGKPDKFNGEHAEINGWVCNCFSDGNICCVTNLQEDDGTKVTVQIALRHGNATVTRKKGGTRIAKPKYKYINWPANGVIGLPNMNGNKQRPFYREQELQDLMEKHGITGIHYSDPNVPYQLKKYVVDGELKLQEQLIATDGKCIVRGVNKEEREHLYTTVTEIEVQNATWVIKKVEKPNCTMYIIYTEGKLEELKGLPNNTGGITYEWRTAWV